MIDNRVLKIAELAWAAVAERNEADPDGSPRFQERVYERTTEFLIDLDRSFNSSDET